VDTSLIDREETLLRGEAEMEGLHPLDAATQAIEKVAQKRRADELQAWKQWKANPTPERMDVLMDKFEPVFRNKVRAWKAPNVNQAAFLTNLRINAVKAFQSYDPAHKSGAQLKTHLETRLQPTKRFNIRHQNYAYMPEEQVSHIGRIQKMQDAFVEDFGREPNAKEIATELNFSLPKRRQLNTRKVNRILEGQRKDIIGSTFESDPTPHAIQREREVISLLRPELNTDQQKVFDLLYGKNGQPLTSSTTQIAKRLKKSPSQISRLRTGILNKFDEYK